MASDKVPMLAEGHRQLNEELKRLKLERPEIIDSIEEARAHGDLSENAEYHAAKERQGQIEAMIADIDDRLSRALVIDPTTLSGDKVVFGATVTLIDEEEKKIRYQLVGQTEADAKVGRISYNSPLGRALIGRTVGEDVEVTTPAGERYYELDQDRVHLSTRAGLADEERDGRRRARHRARLGACSCSAGSSRKPRCASASSPRASAGWRSTARCRCG